jgi:hypothetical protein
MKNNENNEFSMQGYDKKLHSDILQAFNNLPISFVFTKNTKVDDIEYFSGFSEFFKQNAQLILDILLSKLSKHDSSKLEYIFDHYKNKLNVIIKKYKLNLGNKHIVYEMLLDLVFFYNDKNKEKLSRPFNSTIAKIYKKNQNKDIEKIIDFNYQTKFMQQYNDYFNIHKPHEMKTENGETKYIKML